LRHHSHTMTIRLSGFCRTSRTLPSRTSKRSFEAQLEEASIRALLHEVRSTYPEVTDQSIQALKQNFSAKFSRSLAQYLADLLRPEFGGIRPDVQGSGHESRMSGARGSKRTDVRYSTPEIGLGFVISIKTTHFRDAKRGDFNHNETRFDAEFRVEAAEIHERSPFGVLIGLFVLPEISAMLYTEKQPSSFAKWVRRLRSRAGRGRPEDRNELFERIYIGLYDPEGNIRFFDVMQQPPIRGMPPSEDLLTLAQFIGAVIHEYKRRNNVDFDFGPSTIPEEK
jgi:hypothetical protein